MGDCLQSSPELFRDIPDANLPEKACTRTGIASGNRMSVRAAAFHIADQELHHLVSIQENSST